MSGWWPIVREPYTGAWQLNDPLTTETALSNPSVFAVVSRIASDISKIAPPLLLEQDDNGFWTETTNSAYTPVLRRPNRYQTPQQFHERVVLSILLNGNAYILKNRDERGVVNALYPLDPSRVKVLVAPDGAVYYELQHNDLAGHSQRHAAGHRARAGDHPYPVELPVSRSDGDLAALRAERGRDAGANDPVEQHDVLRQRRPAGGGVDRPDQTGSALRGSGSRPMRPIGRPANS